MYRFSAVLVVLASIVSLLQIFPSLRHTRALPLPLPGVSGGPIPADPREIRFDKRADSPTDVCFRWAQQSAVVNGTLYLYGGEATNTSGQTENTWNNNFITLTLTENWETGSPPLVGLPQPSGPPAVALGYLWNSHDSLYLYGGEFSSAPPVSPVAFATWQYDIPTQTWNEYDAPVTSAGVSAPDGDVLVQRSAEGAGVNIPQLGRGYYFGGHEDGYTTLGWSQSIDRIYLQSLLEFTFPGYTNDQVTSLESGADAGSGGVYRNITVGGLQADAGFTARADGLLLFIPGFGAQGILLALAGGTNTTFTQMNDINVYDIATSSWYTQSTSGSTPKIRVNPCAVVAAAADGSSYNIYMWGGQDLTPAGNQTQYDDMWILTVPAFQWIEVDQTGQSIPPGRSGHTCNIWDAQLISVGGYLGADSELTCESPGIYVFDLSALEWVEQFTALSPGTDDGSSDTSDDKKSSSSTFNSTGSDNPFNQQLAQLANATDPGGLEGSYAYEVPEAVISIIGGGKTGGATITKPIATATAGPLATGSAQTYTVTGPNGATVTETSAPGSTSSSSGSSGKNSPNIAAIVVGVVCGILAIIICYLLFCLYIYRKQLALYKRHVEMSQRQARGEKGPSIPGLWASDTSAKSSSDKARKAVQLNPEGRPFLSGSSSGPDASAAASSSTPTRGRTGYSSADRSASARSSTEDLLAGNEPTFVGVMLNPRRSLRVINRD